MRREVVDDEVLELVGPGSERPVEVVLVQMRDGAHLPDRALLDEHGRDPPCRRPATVLVDGDPQPAVLGLRDELARDAEIQRERLLGEHVLPRPERPLHQLDSLRRMGRHVHDLDPRVVEQLVEALEHPADDRKPLLQIAGRVRRGVVHADYVHSVVGVCRQVSELDDPTAADDSDSRAILGGERRPMVGGRSAHDRRLVRKSWIRAFAVSARGNE